MASKDIKYSEEYNELQEQRIPALRQSLVEYNELLENAMGYRLTEPIPNIEIQYNNTSINIDWEFRRAGIEPNDSLVRAAIRDDMLDIVYHGIQCLIQSADLITQKGKEEEILGKVDDYYDFDHQMWKYDYRKDIVDHIMVYFLDTYQEVKKQIEEDNQKTGKNESSSVDAILTHDMIEEIIDTLRKLDFSEKDIKDAEEKWYEVLLDVLRAREKREKKERKRTRIDKEER